MVSTPASKQIWQAAWRLGCPPRCKIPVAALKHYCMSDKSIVGLYWNGAFDLGIKGFLSQLAIQWLDKILLSWVVRQIVLDDDHRPVLRLEMDWATC